MRDIQERSPTSGFLAGLDQRAHQPRLVLMPELNYSCCCQLSLYPAHGAMHGYVVAQSTTAATEVEAEVEAEAEAGTEVPTKVELGFYSSRCRQTETVSVASRTHSPDLADHL